MYTENIVDAGAEKSEVLEQGQEQLSEQEQSQLAEDEQARERFRQRMGGPTVETKVADNQPFGQVVDDSARQETKAEEKTAAQIEQEKKVAEAEAAKKAEEDWLKSVPESIRNSLANIGNLPGRIKNIEGHIGGLTSVTKEIRSALQAKADVEKTGGAAPSKEQVEAASINSEKWNKLKDDFPEWVDAMEERLSTLTPKQEAVDVDGIAAKVAEQFSPQIESAQTRARQLALLDLKHEGWEDTLKTPEFIKFAFDGGPPVQTFNEINSLFAKRAPEAKMAVLSLAEKYPQWWSDKGYAVFSESAKDAITMLDKYQLSLKKDDPTINTPERESKKARLEAAITPTKGLAAPQREFETENEAAKRRFRERMAGR